MLQQEIRKLAASNGLTIIGSEVQEPELLEDVDKLRVNVRARGLPENVARFFQSLSAYRPFLFVSTLSINPNRRQLNTVRSPERETYDNTLSIQLDIYAYQLGDMKIDLSTSCLLNIGALVRVWRRFCSSYCWSRYPIFSRACPTQGSHHQTYLPTLTRRAGHHRMKLLGP